MFQKSSHKKFPEWDAEHAIVKKKEQILES